MGVGGVRSLCLSFTSVFPGFKNLGQFSGFEPQLLLEDGDGEERMEGLMFQSIFLEHLSAWTACFGF